MKAYILIKVEVGKVEKVIKVLRRYKEFSAIDAVSGPFDIIATIEAKTLEDVSRIVIDKIHKVDGIRETNTCIVVS